MTYYIAPGIPDKYPNTITKKQIAECVISDLSKLCGVNIMNRTRKREFVQGRQVAFYILSYYVRIGLNTIAELLTLDGNKTFDHATVLHGRKTVQNLLDTDESFRNQFLPTINYYKDEDNQKKSVEIRTNASAIYSMS